MRAALSLGSNLGDREAHLKSAVEGLDGVLAVSRIIETSPVGGPPQPGYLNAAVVLETDLDAKALLGRCLALERAAGRTRGVLWGPRTLDVDLLLFGDRVIDEPGLNVPHPRLAQRAFVLEPLAEIAPLWVVPGAGRTVEQLLGDLQVCS